MRYFFLLVFISCLSCATHEKHNDPIQFALSSDTEKIQRVLQNLEAHEVQIMVTDADGNDFSFQVNDKNYFYPASSVKFPVALLALEKANSIPQIHSEMQFQIDGDSVKTTIREEIRKIFAISDNAAYNRLFEFMGQSGILIRLTQKDVQSVQISHRLATKNAAATQTKPISFFTNNNIVYRQDTIHSLAPYVLNLDKQQKGKGFYKNDSLIMQSMDFSEKNYLPISTLHELMKRLQFPHKYSKKKQFNFTESDRQFLLETMHATPKEQGFDTPEYYDSYVKFFMYGDTKEPIPDHVNIYNKVGYAYGYLTDCAYIVDIKNDISFVITATIHVNKNQIFNDDTYEYDEIGIPFLAELGRQVHQFYLHQKNIK